MIATRQPSRVLLIAAGAATQLTGAACLVLGLASLPEVHDLHDGSRAVIASIVAALAAMVCGTLAYRGRLVPLGLAAGLDVGFGIVLGRGGSAISALIRILPDDELTTADTLATVGAVAMFVAAVLCVIAIPSALALRRWARAEVERGAGDEPSPSRTLKGFGPARLVPTQIIRTLPARNKPFVIVGVAMAVVAIGIVVIAATTGETRSVEPGVSHRAGSATTVTAAAGTPNPSVEHPVATEARPGASVERPVAIDAAAAATSAQPDDLVTTFHDAIARGDLGLVLEPKVFAFGAEAHEVAEGKDAVAAMLHSALGARVEARFTQLGHDGDVGWLAEELHVGTRTFVVSAALEARDGTWTIAALHWAIAMPNETAYRLARDGNLAVPDAIPDTHDASALAAAMRTAFASKPSFVDARSARADAFNFGSAPGERIAGGDAIKKTFGRIRATIRLHGAIKVGAIGDRGGWGAANVDFVDADRDGTDVTQTFRVLAVWVREDAGWRIVQTQWSNAR